MSVNLLVTSFYTPNWEYAEHAARLRGDCERLGLGHHIVPRDDQGDYLANCRMKPHHVLETLAECNRPTLWLDADASLDRLPAELLTCEEDFAAVPMGPHRDRSWHVGTLYFGTTDRAMELAVQWVGALEDGGSDELALHRAWTKWAGSSLSLPLTYHCVGRYRDQDSPVVRHRLSKGESKRALHAR